MPNQQNYTLVSMRIFVKTQCDEATFLQSCQFNCKLGL